jgi:hypothetical protein
MKSKEQGPEKLRASLLRGEGSVVCLCTFSLVRMLISYDGHRPQSTNNGNFDNFYGLQRQDNNKDTAPPLERDCRGFNVGCFRGWARVLSLGMNIMFSCFREL